MDVGYGSIRGKVRHRDEDSILLEQDVTLSLNTVMERALFALADGMGGGEKGEEASRIAVQGVRESKESIMSLNPLDHTAIINALLDTMHYSNEKIIQYKKENELYGMGTTLTLAYYAEGWLHVVNAGDSRGYIFNYGTTVQKTVDNSYVMEIVKSGKLAESDLRKHPRRNELTVALGFEDNFNPEAYLWRCFSGDSIMLCCDGLWSVIDPTFLSRASTSNVSCQDAIDSLITYANETDGTDNISAILIRPTLVSDEEESLRRPTITSVSYKSTV